MAIKYSIVIPTRNRVDLLKQCIHTILDQNFNDLEIVISDNFSDDDTGRWIKSLEDTRIKYYRTSEFLSVTENWNNCIEKASGDYILMLGDDDGLAPNYFLKLEEILKSYKDPAVIYNSCYRFIAPGIIHGHVNSSLGDERYAFFFEGKEEPFYLSTEERKKAYIGSLTLKRNFSFNMQALIFSKAYLKSRLSRGSFFNGPFPDYYVANVVMLKAPSVLAVPYSLTIAGTAKESFGGSLFTSNIEAGKKMLNNKSEDLNLPISVKKKIINPGPYYLNNYMLTMAQVICDYKKDVHCKLNFNRYRTKVFYEYLTSNPESANMTLGEAFKDNKFCLYFLIKALSINSMLPQKIQQKVTKRLHRYIHIHGYQPKSRIITDGEINRMDEAYHYLKSCKKIVV